MEISKAGILVPPGDSDALACAWADLANDSERRLSMGNSGRKAVESNFSAHEMAEKTAKWYSLIL
jgi:glycosyltransferase involved in cell wall biosynthesis